MTLQAEIRSKLLAFETEFREMGFNLSRAFENVDLEPAMTCINNAKLVERILSEICEKKGIRLGDESKKTIENLLNVIKVSMRQAARSSLIPTRVDQKIRGIQMTRNRATHNVLPGDEITPDDAVESLGQLSVVAEWYFSTYLAEPDDGSASSTTRPQPEPVKALSSTANQSSTDILNFAILYKRHSETDEQVLTWLETQLKAAGHRVFIDRHLDVGIEWAKEIERQVRAADVVIPLLSAASVRSEMMAYEIRTAYEAAQTQKGKPRLLPVRVNYLEALPDEIKVALDHLQYFLWTGPQDNQSLIENMKRALQNPPAAESSSALGKSLPKPVLEQEGGAVPLDSPFYVVREVDNEFYQAIGRRDSILLLKGARQMGKTSLLSRALRQARASGFRVAITDFQTLNANDLQSVKSFYFALATKIAVQLDLERFPEETWREHLGPNDNFERYLRREVLAKSTAPLVWAMDEVDRLFTCGFGSE